MLVCTNCFYFFTTTNQTKMHENRSSSHHLFCNRWQPNGGDCAPMRLRSGDGGYQTIRERLLFFSHRGHRADKSTTWQFPIFSLCSLFAAHKAAWLASVSLAIVNRVCCADRWSGWWICRHLLLTHRIPTHTIVDHKTNNVGEPSWSAQQTLRLGEIKETWNLYLQLTPLSPSMNAWLPSWKYDLTQPILTKSLAFTYTKPFIFLWHVSLLKLELHINVGCYFGSVRLWLGV